MRVLLTVPCSTSCRDKATPLDFAKGKGFILLILCHLLIREMGPGFGRGSFPGCSGCEGEISTWPSLWKPLHRAEPPVPSVPPGPASRGLLQTLRRCRNPLVFNGAAPPNTRFAVHFYLLQIKMLKKVAYDSRKGTAFTSP